MHLDIVIIEIYTEYGDICRSRKLTIETNFICEDMKSQLNKLLDIERNYYRNEIQHKIRACWYDQNLSHLKDTLMKVIKENIDNNLDLDDEQLRDEYEKIWSEWLSQDLKEEEENERNKEFDDLYMLFKMESKMMENKHTIFQQFNSLNFQMNDIIGNLESIIIGEFQTYTTQFSPKDSSIHWRENSLGHLSAVHLL